MDGDRYCDLQIVDRGFMLIFNMLFNTERALQCHNYSILERHKLPISPDLLISDRFQKSAKSLYIRRPSWLCLMEGSSTERSWLWCCVPKTCEIRPSVNVCQPLTSSPSTSHRQKSCLLTHHVNITKHWMYFCSFEERVMYRLSVCRYTDQRPMPHTFQSIVSIPFLNVQIFVKTRLIQYLQGPESWSLHS